jgi:menaquinone-9 beta-reductase
MEFRTASREAVDVVIVGGRVAGCAVAIPLARAGRSVVVLERARFPSNTLSTHGLFPGHVAELDALGALGRVLACEPPLGRRFDFHLGDVHLVEPVPSHLGFDYGICVGRPQLDMALVETARDAGAEVREGCTATEVVHAGSRVAGVRYTRASDGREVSLGARLVVGADGRYSRMAEFFGVGRPYRTSRNLRGFAWRYMSDPRRDEPARFIISRGRTVAMVGPMPAGLMIVATMPPVSDIGWWRKDANAAWAAMLAEHPVVVERVVGATVGEDELEACGLPASVLSCSRLTSFFRASTGAGWALAGDAGHFKDPTVAQGIRDALRHGRLLGEIAASCIDVPWELDRSLAGWEMQRDRDCISSYHWANRESRFIPELDVVFGKVLKSFQTPARDGGLLADALCRKRRPEQVLDPRRSARCLLQALAEPGVDRRRLLGIAAGEARAEIDLRLERRSHGFRNRGPTASERPEAVSS